MVTLGGEGRRSISQGLAGSLRKANFVLHLKGEVGVTQVTVSVEEVGMAFQAGRRVGARAPKQKLGRGSQRWPFGSCFDCSVGSGLEEHQIRKS